MLFFGGNFSLTEKINRKIKKLPINPQFLPPAARTRRAASRRAAADSFWWNQSAGPADWFRRYLLPYSK